MTIEIYSAKDFKKICLCNCIDDYHIYKSQNNNWCVSIDYFDEAEEEECFDVITLCPATSDEATEDLIVLTKKYGLTEIFSSEAMSNQIYKLAAGLIQGLQIIEGGNNKEDLYMHSKQFLNSLFGMCVTDIILQTKEEGEKQ